MTRTGTESASSWEYVNVKNKNISTSVLVNLKITSLVSIYPSIPSGVGSEFYSERKFMGS